MFQDGENIRIIKIEQELQETNVLELAPCFMQTTGNVPLPKLQDRKLFNRKDMQIILNQERWGLS